MSHFDQLNQALITTGVMLASVGILVFILFN